MDYSLFLFIERLSYQNNELNYSSYSKTPEYRDQGLKFHQVDYYKKEKIVTKRYHIGVIDYLQQWNMNKKSEYYFKTFC